MDSLPSVQNSAQSTLPIKTQNSHRKPTKNSRAFLAAKKKNKFKYSIPSFASTLPSDDSLILSEQSPRNVSSQDVEKNSVRTSSCSSTVPVSQSAGIDVMIQQAKISKAAGIGSVVQQAKMSKASGIDIMIQQAKMSKAAGIDSVIQQAKISKAAGIGSVIQQAKMSKASGTDIMIHQAKMSKAAGIDSVIQQAKMSKDAGVGNVIQQVKMSKGSGIGNVIQQAKVSKAAAIDSVIQQAKMSKAAEIGSWSQQAKMSKAAGVDIAIKQAKQNAVSQLQQDGCTGHFISFDSQFVLEITGTNKIPGLIAFGDSTVDAGNNNQVLTLIKANFPPYGQDFEGGKPTGRFCNGRLPTDFLSEMLGIKRSIPAYLDPAFGIEDFATGVTFASSGTGFDVATSTILAVIPLSKELDYFKEYLEKLTSFLGNDTAAETARESLYIISIGTNDFVLNYFTVPGRSFQFTVDEYQDFLLGTARNFLIELHSLGARKIVIVGLPPNDCLPIVKTLDLVPVRPSLEEIKKASIDYNVKLQNLVWSLSIELEGIKLVYADIYNPLLHIIQNPNLYGIEDFATGVAFASAATGYYDVVTSKLFAVIPISEKLEYFKEYLKKLSSFLGKDGAVKITRESFYYIIIGTNDFILNYFTVPVRSLQFTVAEYEDFLLGIARNFLIELYSLGAINIVLAGVLPSGCLPFEYRA
ncbi:hypothetical protein C5167_018549 [Papaver somniferum]|uniref:SGNH hydrolase-type esterase domain-containing protein n=1 Tax=Papaver somniferum TaxID=3469 RepID=A0A4Y7IN72_PAPSO|nr:hypothetical protein C5167_018549 [Papaver somniferum]